MTKQENKKNNLNILINSLYIWLICSCIVFTIDEILFIELSLTSVSFLLILFVPIILLLPISYYFYLLYLKIKKINSVNKFLCIKVLMIVSCLTAYGTSYKYGKNLDALTGYDLMKLLWSLFAIVVALLVVWSELIVKFVKNNFLKENKKEFVREKIDTSLINFGITFTELILLIISTILLFNNKFVPSLLFFVLYLSSYNILWMVTEIFGFFIYRMKMYKTIMLDENNIDEKVVGEKNIESSNVNNIDEHKEENE